MAYEDWTTYTETDPNAHITVAANKIDFDGYRNEDAYVYKDAGAGHFTDFTHDVDTAVDADYNDEARAGIWMVAESVDDILGQKTNNMESISAYLWVVDFTFNDFRGVLYETDGAGNNYTDATAATFFTLDTTYYWVMQKATTAMTAKIYSDAARTNLLDTLSLTLQADYSLQYIYGCASYNSGHALHVEVDVMNLDLNEAAGLSIPVAMHHYNHHIAKIIRG